ncbi:hypothetical protein M5689_003299 [Euphorbia peplus]|nr:hypothetical protein M5689_003299 [Euphorbia peplus]
MVVLIRIPLIDLLREFFTDAAFPPLIENMYREAENNMYYCHLFLPKRTVAGPNYPSVDINGYSSENYAAARHGAGREAIQYLRELHELEINDFNSEEIVDIKKKQEKLYNTHTKEFKELCSLNQNYDELKHLFDSLSKQFQTINSSLSELDIGNILRNF